MKRTLDDSLQSVGRQTTFKAVTWVLACVAGVSGAVWGGYLNEELRLNRDFQKRSRGEIRTDIREIEHERPVNIDIITVEDALWTGITLRKVEESKSRAGPGNSSASGQNSSENQAETSGKADPEQFYLPIMSNEKLPKLVDYQKLMDVLKPDTVWNPARRAPRLNQIQTDQIKQKLESLKPDATIQVVVAAKLMPECAKQTACVEDRLKSIRGKISDSRLPSFDLLTILWDKPNFEITSNPMIIDSDDVSPARPANWFAVVAGSLVPISLVLFTWVWNFKGEKWI